jgi:hypothetical protein
MSATAIRNLAIIAGLAAIGVLWQGAGVIAGGLSQIILVLFVFAMVAFGYRYFKERQLAWLVLSDTQRAIIIGAVAGVVILVLGFSFIAPLITPLGVVALIAILVVIAVWTIRESQRWR